MEKIRVGISSCLLGEKVRWNGGHQRDSFLVETLGKFCEWIPVCPEVECGLPVPRETLRLVGDPVHPRLVTTRSREDKTEQMTSYVRRRVEELAREDLCAFIFKSDSPSSGMERVKVYDEKGMPHKVGVGVFARAFMERFPHIPVEEDGRLHDPKLRETFVEAIFTLQRWRSVLARKYSVARLVEFHAEHKLLLLAHSPELYRKMGSLVGKASQRPIGEVYCDYMGHLVQALRVRTTRGKNENVLAHILGYFKHVLPSEDRKELTEMIANYRKGLLPLIVPVTLFAHHARVHGPDWLRGQVYLNPHPLELQLRNHV